MKLSEIIRVAAERHLEDPFQDDPFRDGQWRYSCIAVEEALDRLIGTRSSEQVAKRDELLERFKSIARSIFSACGVSDEYKAAAFFDGHSGLTPDEAQHARVMWLELLALEAEEAGD